MTTVINNPGNSDQGTGAGLVIGILLVIFLAVLFVIFGLPYLHARGTAPTGASVNVQLPSSGGNAGGTGGAAQ